jgi:glycerophosphoryl diester phosphodiesterase
MPVSFRAVDNGFVHVCGHRGYSVCFPENTIIGFDGARKSGATTIEIDIVLSRDGEAVLMHDEILDRTTNGHGFVGDLDLAAIGELDAGIGFGGRFAGTRIPTLSETMIWAKKHNIGVVIEMKERERPDQLSSRLLEVLHETDSSGHALALSFNHVDLAKLKEKEPGIRVEAILHARHVNIVSVVKACGADSVSIELNMFAAEDAAALHAAGLSNRLSLPKPEKLAQYWAHGRDLRAKIGEWLRAGLVDSVSGDDVAFTRKLIEQNPISVSQSAKAKVSA